MRKEFVILATIAMITVSTAAVAVAVVNMSDDPGNSQQIKGLSCDLTAESRMTALDAPADADVHLLHYSEAPPNNYFFLEMPYDENLDRYMDMGHAVLFTPAKSFIVEGVIINGTYNSTMGYVPFTVELRDDKSELLYQHTDVSIAYFPTEPRLTIIEIPATKIDGDFSVILYSRSSVSVGAYVGASNNMSFVVPRGFSREPAMADEGVPLEWTIGAVGRYA